MILWLRSLIKAAPKLHFKKNWFGRSGLALRPSIGTVHRLVWGLNERKSWGRGQDQVCRSFHKLILSCSICIVTSNSRRAVVCKWHLFTSMLRFFNDKLGVVPTRFKVRIQPHTRWQDSLLLSMKGFIIVEVIAVQLSKYEDSICLDFCNV